MQARKPRDFPAGLLPGAVSPHRRSAGIAATQRCARPREPPVAGVIPCSFFVNLQGLYSRLPAQAGYGDKWPS